MGRFKFRGEPVSMLAIVANLFVSMGGFISLTKSLFSVGYDTGYISGCLIMPYFQIAFGTPDLASSSGFSLSPRRQSVVVSLLSAGCFAGALLGVPTADFLGRRGAIFMMSFIFIVGVIVQIAPTGNLGALMGGRFVAGLGVGALSALVPLYQGEISPKALRGAFVSCYQVMITFGILVAYVLDLACKGIDGTASYKIPIGLQVIWGSILCAGVPFLPRSPRESILNGDIEVARVVIARMHAISVQDPLVQAYIDEIREKIEEEKHSGTTYLDCFDFRNEFKTGQRTLIGCLVQSFQQLTGQIIFGLLDMIGTFPGLYCLDRFGRRRTMIAGALVMGLSYMLYAVIGSYALYPNNDPTQVARKGAGGGMLFVICVFVLSFGCSWGPGGWVNTGEIAPLRTRAKQLSFVSASNWVWNFLLSYFSPPISAKIGAKYGFVFFGANFLAAAFIYFFVPEMAGLSLEKINGLFQAGIPARKSFEYNKQVRQQDRKNQDIISAGGETKLGGQDAKEREMVHVEFFLRTTSLLWMSSHGMLDSSPLTATPFSNPLKRTASTASLPTPPRTVKKRSRSRPGSVFACSDDEDDHALPELTRTSRARPETDEDKSEGNHIVAGNKRRRIDELAAELSDERDLEEAFWMDHASSSSSSAKPKPSVAQRTRHKPPSLRRIPGADRLHPRTSSVRRLSQSRSHPTTLPRTCALPSPPPSRVRPPVTPPRATAANRRRREAKKAPVRDSPNNPFLVDSPASVPSSPIEPRTPTSRQEKPTLTYVFRGKKQEFQNPHYNAPVNPRAQLPMNHPDFSPSENCTPRRLFPSRPPMTPIKPKPSTRALSPDLLGPQTASKRLLSPDPWDSDADDEPEPLMPPRALIEEFQKIGAKTALAAMKEVAKSKQEEEEERPIKPLPARGRPEPGPSTKAQTTAPSKR
ncbi:hypothetical protein EW146_g432 [Bondarzewia mesenterica]|uniref:Major facilitator superfamily (MFS) profile domain-containing protein n=1 Tax=Bondarzewia mesenterica TaxID=1095465 RepID=A0A4S4M6Z4_9AGAM|nr:hypothetical protein EW146_g432 [Bondarzewia mesenterica]